MALLLQPGFLLPTASRRMQSQNPALNSIHFFHTFGLLVHGSFTFIDDSMRNRG